MIASTPIRHPARTMLYRSCPRCHGDLIMDPESRGENPEAIDFICPQCGRSVAMRLIDVQQSTVRRTAA